MPISLFDAVVPSNLQILRAVDALLDKAEAFCAETGRAESELVDARLAPDMLPFGYQVKSCAAHSVGAIAGAITFIPYVGSLVGGALAIGLALFQFWGDWVSIAVVAAIFAFGQFIEGNILSPKLVGGSVGLHPVWLLFALSAFGTVFGFVGMLAAVPVAAMIGVLARFGITQYRVSSLYRGIEERAPPHRDAPPP